MTAISAVLVALLLAPASQQAPRRDSARPGLLTPDGTSVEADLEKRIAAAPADEGRYLELATLQESRGDIAAAEATLLRARAAAPVSKRVVEALASLYKREGDGAKALPMAEIMAEIDPANAEAQNTVASLYFEKLRAGKELPAADRNADVTAGLAAADRALAVDPEYGDALALKGLLLRMRSSLEENPAIKERTLAEAAALQARAVEIRNAPAAGAPDAATTPSEQARDPLPQSSAAPVRVGGDIKAPTKIKDVAPVYPAEAEAARVAGIVMLELTIGIDGRVSDQKVLRSVPVLDQAAIEAVSQWEFTPTYLNGEPVPVVMTATVNFKPF